MSDTRRNQPKKGNRNNWMTPPEVFDALNFYTLTTMGKSFDLDIAASEKNSMCDSYINQETDALHEDTHFESGLWFGNPPFNKIGEFLDKAYLELLKYGHEGFMLAPSSQETKWFRNNITYRNLPFLIYPRRINFLEPDTGLPSESGNVIATAIVAFVKDRKILKPMGSEPWKVNL